MPPGDEIDGDQAGDQKQRSGERGCFESIEREGRVRGGLDGGSRRSRIDRVGEQRNDHLEHSQGFVRAGRPGRGLGVGIRGKRGQAGEKESSEAHETF